MTREEKEIEELRELDYLNEDEKLQLKLYDRKKRREDEKVKYGNIYYWFEYSELRKNKFSLYKKQLYIDKKNFSKQFFLEKEISVDLLVELSHLKGWENLPEMPLGDFHTHLGIKSNDLENIFKKDEDGNEIEEDDIKNVSLKVMMTRVSPKDEITITMAIEDFIYFEYIQPILREEIEVFKKRGK